MRGRLVRYLLILVVAMPSIALSQVSINIESVAGDAGNDVELDVSLSVSGGPAVVATQNELQFPPSIAVVSCRVNDAIGKDASLFTFLPQGCQRGINCTRVRALVFSLSDSNPIPDGSLLYTCKVRIDADVVPGRDVIGCQDALASTADARPLPASCPAAPVVVSNVADVSILVGGATVVPGQRAIFDVAIEHRAAPAATQNDLHFPPQAHVRSCSFNPAINKDLSLVTLLPQGCVPGIDCSTARTFVFSLDDTSTIASGSVLYTCTVDIDGGTPLGSVLPIACGNAGASESDATELQTECRDGALSVVEPIVALALGRTAVAPGERAIVPLVANALRGDVAVVGIQTELRVSGATPIAAQPNGTPGCSTDLPGVTFQELSFQPPGCLAGLDCSGVRASVVGSAPIPDGATAFQCAFDIPDSTAPGSYPLRHVPGMQLATDGDGAVRGATTSDGEIVVRFPCIGDCNGDNQVPISELVTGINVFLGRAPIASCLAFDRDLNGLVTVDELVTGIVEALRGCSN